MSQKQTDRAAPVLLRAFKKEAEIEVWKQAKDGRYVLLKSYPVCRWSGQLGPKMREGDRQVPEGFYTVTASGMNPNSALWLSFNIGYPNVLERSQGRTGTDIMVHGDCSSRGCFAMTDKQMEEIYALVREAFNGGQKSIQFQSYPFRMTTENLAKFRQDPNIQFWRNLKDGNDHFEVTKAEPRVGYCGGKYVFNAESSRNDPAALCSSIAVDPSIASAVASKQREDDRRVADLVQRGAPAIRVQYADGGQNVVFNNSGYGNYDTQERVVTASAMPQQNLRDVSRPEAINDVKEYAIGQTSAPKTPRVGTPVIADATTASFAPIGSKPTSPKLREANIGLVPKDAVPTKKSETGLSSIGALIDIVQPEASSQATIPDETASADKPFYKKWFN